MRKTNLSYTILDVFFEELRCDADLLIGEEVKLVMISLPVTEVLVMRVNLKKHLHSLISA